MTMESRQFIAFGSWYWGHQHRDSTRYRCGVPPCIETLKGRTLFGEENECARTEDELEC